MGNTASSNDKRKSERKSAAAAATTLSAEEDAPVASVVETEQTRWQHWRSDDSRKKLDGITTKSTKQTEVVAVSTKAAGESAAAAATAAQRLKQTSNWSLGSLSGRWNWSFSGASRSSFRNRNRPARKSLTSLQQRRAKTTWHRPLTNVIFSSHFKESSRNEQFHIEHLIAKGAFGVVFKVSDKRAPHQHQHQHQQQQQRQRHQSTLRDHHNKQTNAESEASPPLVYALKVLKKSKIIEEQAVQQIKDEADIQKLCGHHPFIVQQVDLWQNRHNLHILSEYVPNGELYSKISKFSTDLIRLYLAEIALALDFLHNAGVIYRDAKPENILLTANYHIKLTDFGLSKWLKLGGTTKTMCGTFQYMVFDLAMEGRQVDEAVASIFHTVLFHRCLGKYMYTGDAQYSIGTVGYTDVDCDFIDFTYVCCTSDSLNRKVKRAINIFSEKLRSNESCGSGQISLEFFQKKKSRWPFQQECIPWEVWTIHLDLIKYENEDDRQLCRENVSDLLTEKVIYITELMNRHDYVPKTPSQSELDLIFDTSFPDVQPYLFKFDYQTAGSNVPSMGNAMKKIIKETLAL